MSFKNLSPVHLAQRIRVASRLDDDLSRKALQTKVPSYEVCSTETKDLSACTSARINRVMTTQLRAAGDRWSKLTRERHTIEKLFKYDARQLDRVQSPVHLAQRIRVASRLDDDLSRKALQTKVPAGDRW